MEKKPKEKIFIEHMGKRFQLVGVKAMLVPEEEIGNERRKVIWADVKLDTLMLKAALDTRKMEKKKRY
jgi:hypothetical protein